jgi:hypothetical protein
VLVAGTQWANRIFIVLLSQQYGHVACETDSALETQSWVVGSATVADSWEFFGSMYCLKGTKS